MVSAVVSASFHLQQLVKACQPRNQTEILHFLDNNTGQEQSPGWDLDGLVGLGKLLKIEKDNT